MKILGLTSSIILSLSSLSSLIFTNNPRTLYDLKGNIFKLYEDEESYSIYAMKDGLKFKIESGDFESPYYNVKSNELYYFGPFNYFYKENDYFINLENNEKYESSQFQNLGIDLNLIEYDVSLTSGELYYCNNYNYFRKLNVTPSNNDNACGIVALQMLLGYYDTFYDDRFVDYLYYKDSTNPGYLIKESNLGTYNGQKKYYFGLWNESPGTTQSMYKYLFNNYKHTIVGITGKYNPMSNQEMKATFNDYILDNCPELINDFSYYEGALIDVSNNKPYEFIAQGNPIALVLNNGTIQDSLGSESYSKEIRYRIVVAYGYYDSNYIIHCGWTGKKYKKMYLTKYLINAYFGINFNVGHINHSHNAYLIGEDNSLHYVCGCGEVS